MLEGESNCDFADGAQRRYDNATCLDTLSRNNQASTGQEQSTLSCLTAMEKVTSSSLRNNGRPYRSKRHPPCSQCRRKKLRCQGPEHGGCERCRTAGASCSFLAIGRTGAVGQLAHNRSPRERSPAPDQEQDNITIDAEAASIHQTEPNITDEAMPNDPFGVVLADDDLTPLLCRLPERSTGQAIQSIDLLNGFSSQVIGTSGESDPWLLRHGKFDERGYILFHEVHFRNAGGVPLEEKIPAHFLVSADGVYESAKETTRYGKDDKREELNSLVPLECGQRLVSLFVNFVFPALPIISRSQFGLSASRSIPDQETLKSIPVHLLAAIYATAYQFMEYDDYLSIVNAYTDAPISELWRMVIELIMSEIHTSHLSILQAGLLYLHRRPRGPENSVADSPFSWSFLGLLVGVATCLGLQLDCRLIGLPAWEKRLRLRLWWALYAEDKWRSLLMGRPPYIRNDEWDVTDLDDEDFRLDGMPVEFLLSESTKDQYHQDALNARTFRHFVGLARIADDVQHSLFSLRAAQRLSSNFTETLTTAHMLLRSLKGWYSSLPSTMKLQNRGLSSTNSTGIHPQQHTGSLHFAYILLEVFVFRCILRPMVRSATPPRLFEETDLQNAFADPVDDYIAQIIDSDEVEPTPAVDMCTKDSSGIAALTAAENCAARTLRFVMRMPYQDGGVGFWHSWCRVGFATVSNFMMLLLVQAPSADHAMRAQKILQMWRQTLRTQSQGNEWMKLALVRMDSAHWKGLSQSYYLPKHVREVLEFAGE